MTEPLTSKNLLARLRHVERLDKEECDAFTREAMLDAADEIERLTRERDTNFHHYTSVVDERDRLAAELKKAKAMPMKYRRMEFNAQLQNENDRLRAALERIVNGSFSCDDPKECGSQVIAREALAGVHNHTGTSPTGGQSHNKLNPAQQNKLPDETTAVHKTPPGAMYSTSYCEKHRNQPWSYTITAFTSNSAVMPRIVCPLCFPPDSK